MNRKRTLVTLLLCAWIGSMLPVAAVLIVGIHIHHPTPWTIAGSLFGLTVGAMILPTERTPTVQEIDHAVASQTHNGTDETDDKTINDPDHK